MAEDLKAPDSQRPIDVNRVDEVQYWCERLGVSEHALRQAVADVGASAEQVAVHLGKC
ncbi:DUF3606 domain-containing protein [Variovorax saccharolyticus]|uniref:DUF3606 domain-containing protein n=1 Tax=Variovorax saccharolyticus TaxID=3053516 RepID=UPI002577DFFC|nr:DUF3606 domain-containing protein [Variovorax sp. J31P216]MDM0024036.1 DUF3606 domain-containing protein [Variovorax sp. J31P216]